MRKVFVRYLILVVAALLLAFLAKMEAINFLLALPVGAVATVYVFRWQQKVYQKVGESVDSLSPWILSLTLGLIMATYRWRIEFVLPSAAGFFSGYLVYSALNLLFISP